MQCFTYSEYEILNTVFTLRAESLCEARQSMLLARNKGRTWVYVLCEGPFEKSYTLSLFMLVGVKYTGSAI